MEVIERAGALAEGEAGAHRMLHKGTCAKNRFLKRQTLSNPIAIADARVQPVPCVELLSIRDPEKR